MLQNCTKADETIHCLSDEHNNTGIGCFTVAWINKDSGCYVRKIEKPTTAEGAVSEPIVTDYHSGTGNETNQGGASCEKCESGWRIGFFVLVAIFPLALAAVVFVMKNKRCRPCNKESSGKDEKDSKLEDEPLNQNK
eukprot:XP_019921335.1 PREDICTED: uncharacterized protein LOC105324915 isoform X2 [Crassostrea gigas]